MNKKYKSGLLIWMVLVQVIGMFPVNILATDSESLEYEIAKAYAEVVRDSCNGEIFDESNMIPVGPRNMDMPPEVTKAINLKKGLLQGELIDLDGDGIKEIVLLRKVPFAYPEERNLYNVIQGFMLDIYTYVDGKAKLIYSLDTVKEMREGVAVTETYALTKLEDGYILTESYETRHEIWKEIKSLQGLQFETILAYDAEDSWYWGNDDAIEGWSKEWKDAIGNLKTPEEASVLEEKLENGNILISIEEHEEGLSLKNINYNAREFLEILERAAVPKLPFEDITASFIEDEKKVNRFIKDTEKLQYIYRASFPVEGDIQYDVNTTTIEEMLATLFNRGAVEDEAFSKEYSESEELYDEATASYKIEISIQTLKKGMMDLFGRIFELEEGVTYMAPDYEFIDDISYTLQGDKVIFIEKGLGKDIPVVYKPIINTVYKTGDDMYIFIVDALIQTGYEGEQEKKIAFYTILAQEVNDGGKLRYIPLRIQKTPDITPQVVEGYQFKEQQKPNIKISYKQDVSGKGALQTLRDLLKASKEKANSLAVTDIYQFVIYHIRNISAVGGLNKNNKITITDKLINKGILQTLETQESFAKLLKDYKIKPYSLILPPVKIDISSVDWQSPVTIKIDEIKKETLKQIDHVLILLGDSEHMIQIPVSSLELLNNKKIMITKVSELTYKIAFFDKDKELAGIEDDIYVTIPSKSNLSTVYATYKGYTENWGGQSNTNQSISFKTHYTGEYQVKDESLEITDIDLLKDIEQESIEFMVSKGFLELEQGKFSPYEKLTRYDFCKVLVKMFFALDIEAKTKFSDIEEGHPYYSYIASGETKEIIKGFEDNMFKGELSVTKEQVLAFCSSVLQEELDVIQEEDTEGFLNYMDKNTISNWAKDAVALTVQEGLIEEGGMLFSANDITRAEASEILYQLFNKLYIKYPESLSVTAEAEVPNNIPLIWIVGILSLLGLLGVAGYRRDKKQR